MAKVNEIFDQYATDPVAHRDELWAESLKHIKRAITWNHEHKDDIAMDTLIRCMTSLSDFNTSRASFARWLSYKAESAEKEKDRRIDRDGTWKAQQAPLPRDEDGVATGRFGDIEALSGEAQVAGRVESQRSREAATAHAQLVDAFEGDAALVERLLDAEGNLAEVSRQTGLTRSALRNKMSRARQRYAELAAA